MSTSPDTGQQSDATRPAVVVERAASFHGSLRGSWRPGCILLVHLFMNSISRRLARPSRAALRVAPFALALSTALPVQAQSPSKLDQVVVTATRSAQKLSDVLADVTVLTRTDIERQAIGSVADLLRTQAGFELIRNGGPGANTSLFVRGADTRHTAVLIDGLRVDSQASSGVSWNAIPLAQIERIEIVRGAASAIYGSDAIGGVVQIFTRKGDGKPLVELGAGGGNRGLAKLDASISGANGLLDYALALAGERSEGFNSRPNPAANAATDKDGYRSRNASLRLGLKPAEGHRIELMGLNSHVNAQYDPSITAVNDDRTLSDTRALRGGWTAQWSPELRTEFSAGEALERYETRPSPYVTETKVRSYTFNGSYKLGQGQINGLLERREDKLVNSGLTEAPTPGAGQRHQDAIGAGYLWAAGPLSLQIHGRHDRDSEFGSSDTGSLAGGYRFTPNWRVQTSIGTAFRAPSLYQRFTEYGKPSLRPEQGRNAELGLHYAQGRDEFSVTAYRNLVRDLIIFGAAGPCKSQFGCYDNVSKGLLQGLTLKAATQFSVVRLSGSLDLQSPKDVGESSANYGKLLARRAKTHASLRADTVLAGWSLGAQVLASSKRIDNQSVAVPFKLGGYATMDFDAQYSLSQGLNLQLKLDNAFDRGYQSARGYASAPRQVFVGLRYSPSL